MSMAVDLRGCVHVGRTPAKAVRKAAAANASYR